jgi:DNA repair protein RadC
MYPLGRKVLESEEELLLLVVTTGHQEKEVSHISNEIQK